MPTRLFGKPRWLALNKADLLPAAERAAVTQKFIADFGWEGRSFIISALTGEGCRLTYHHGILDKTRKPSCAG